MVKMYNILLWLQKRGGSWINSLNQEKLQIESKPVPLSFLQPEQNFEQIIIKRDQNYENVQNSSGNIPLVTASWGISNANSRGGDWGFGEYGLQQLLLALLLTCLVCYFILKNLMSGYLGCYLLLMFLSRLTQFVKCKKKKINYLLTQQHNKNSIEGST